MASDKPLSQAAHKFREELHRLKWMDGTGANLAASLFDQHTEGLRRQLDASMQETMEHVAEWKQRDVTIAELRARLEAAEKELEQARGERDEARTVAVYLARDPDRRLRDHACESCVPDGPIVIERFVCALHKALAWAPATPVYNGSGEPCDVPRGQFGHCSCKATHFPEETR